MLETKQMRAAEEKADCFFVYSLVSRAFKALRYAQERRHIGLQIAENNLTKLTLGYLRRWIDEVRLKHQRQHAASTAYRILMKHTIQRWISNQEDMVKLEQAHNYHLYQTAKAAFFVLKRETRLNKLGKQVSAKASQGTLRTSLANWRLVSKYRS